LHIVIMGKMQEWEGYCGGMFLMMDGCQTYGMQGASDTLPFLFQRTFDLQRVKIYYWT
jgi:hypothetical protein